jgi:hypothetical protein
MEERFESVVGKPDSVGWVERAGQQSGCLTLTAERSTKARARLTI